MFPPERTARIDAVWSALADRPDNTMISPQNRMDIWIVEQRLKAERLATARLTSATKALVWATAVLALATSALVVVTLAAAK